MAPADTEHLLARAAGGDGAARKRFLPHVSAVLASLAPAGK
jgi:hypothetical protein